MLYGVLRMGKELGRVSADVSWMFGLEILVSMSPAACRKVDGVDTRATARFADSLQDLPHLLLSPPPGSPRRKAFERFVEWTGYGGIAQSRFKYVHEQHGEEALQGKYFPYHFFLSLCACYVIACRLSLSILQVF